nr:MAG TPA: hypothetical protein [Caudoviricetes sp.]
MCLIALYFYILCFYCCFMYYSKGFRMPVVWVI